MFFYGMSPRAKKSLKIDELKGLALAKRLKELGEQGEKITEPQIATALEKSRSAVARWKAGQNWPSRSDELALEAQLKLPRGFFAAIGQGKPYAEALQGEGEQGTLSVFALAERRRIAEELDALRKRTRKEAEAILQRQWNEAERIIKELLGGAVIDRAHSIRRTSAPAAGVIEAVVNEIDRGLEDVGAPRSKGGPGSDPQTGNSGGKK